MPEAPPTAGSPAPAPQAPMGQSPAMGATPNRGYEAQGLQRLGVILKQLEQILPLVGATSDTGKTVLKMLNLGAKHVSDGQVTPAAEKNTLDAAQRQNIQNAMMQQQLKARQAGQQATPSPAPPGMAA